MPPKKPAVALVTGAAVRVGRAIAEELAAAGHAVWIHCHRSRREAEALADSLGEACAGVVAADLSDERGRAELCRRVCDVGGPHGGRVDLLVNSAAGFESAPFLSRTDADLRRVLELNLVAPLSLARALAPALQTSRGAIVNVLDLGALHPWRRRVDHCCAKAALAMATRALALELAPAVRVNAVAPGTVAWPEDAEHGDPATRARLTAAIPLGEIGHPADVARAVRFLAENRHIDGQILAVDGGRSADLFGRG